jgi:hypothetical protein
MNQRSNESSSARPPESVNSDGAARPHVRYIGFESITCGRRLSFRVKKNRVGAVDVTFDIADEVLIGTPGISIQDAPAMAYEKLVELLSTEGTLESGKLHLTNADVERYLDRHMTSQKRTSSLTDERRQSDIAA